MSTQRCNTHRTLDSRGTTLQQLLLKQKSKGTSQLSDNMG
jgi:hypothetical protein